MGNRISELAAQIPLIDNHCHGTINHELERAQYEIYATEGDWLPRNGLSVLDEQFGVLTRALVAPLIGLDKHCSPDDYWARRREIGQEALVAQLLPLTGIETFIVDTGFKSDNILTPDQLSSVGNGRAVEIVRLETAAERMITSSSASTFSADYAKYLAEESKDAVGFKSIIAYRYGLDFDPEKPSESEVAAAAAEWIAEIEATDKIRLSHPVLLRHVLWEAVSHKKPIQFHVGFGDSDINLHRCDPTQMTEFIRRTVDTGTNIMLLHCYPFIREAGYLAHVFPHVYLDTGAAINYTGPEHQSLIRHSVEMAPFGKVLFSSDAFGLPELYYCGAAIWRSAIGNTLQGWVDSDAMGEADARKYLTWMASENAHRAYKLP
jgi:predicted TIM-barrel fold metal-dependent hydrolase